MFLKQEKLHLLGLVQEGDRFFIVECNKKDQKHDGRPKLEVEQSILKRKYSHLPSTLAKKQMVADNAKFCVELVGMLKDFLNNPPAPVSVFESMNATVSEDEDRLAFFEASNMQAATEYMAGSERIILISDCTYQTNHQRLVLGSLGLAVLHKDDHGKVRCRFWPVVFSVSEAEDESAYDLLCKAFIDKTGVNPAKVSNIFLDGHAGAFAAMQHCFTGACIHRDLQHVKKNIKENACKLQDRNLKTYITDVVEFSAKLSQPSQFHTVWKDTACKWSGAVLWIFVRLPLQHASDETADPCARFETKTKMRE
ncbi:unnamed protein product [Symbiodinium sp. CCMP2592]|nr:unnamed protein product [Symbiodinium sp. CCMP2592]